MCVPSGAPLEAAALYAVQRPQSRFDVGRRGACPRVLRATVVRRQCA